MTSRIVVLGGGFGGMYAARALKRRLGRAAEIELVNAENYFVFQPLLPEVGAGSITPAHAVSPLRFLLRDVFVRKATVDSVDFDRRLVTVFQGVQRRPTEIGYDHLVIALGQAADLSKMPGLEEHALTMRTLEWQFFDLADYLGWRATGDLARSTCTVTCKWTYLAHEHRWDAGYFRQVGLGVLGATENSVSRRQARKQQEAQE